LWLPTMTDRGLEHMKIPQLKKVPTIWFLHFLFSKTCLSELTFLFS
jgi:hypothetical protein